MQSFEEGVRATGRNPDGMPRLIELNVAYTADKETAIAQHQKYWAGSFVPALYNQKIYTPKLSEQNGKVVGSDAIERMVCISDQADEHVRSAQRHLDLGFDHLIFHSAGPDQRAFIERYGREVLPRLRRQ